MSEPAAKKAKPADKQLCIYMASPLFCYRETFATITLAESLEEKGFKTIVPQRDGFVFAKLLQALKTNLATHKKEDGSSLDPMQAVYDVIYHLDMAEFLPKCDLVIANIDEPPSPGVIVEISYAKLMGIPVIGYRTETRSPYGTLDDPLQGLHFFAGFQCDHFVKVFIPCPSLREAKEDTERLVQHFAKVIKQFDLTPKDGKPTFPLLESSPPTLITSLMDNAKTLFEGSTANIHTEEGIQAVAKRYADNHKAVSSLFTKLSTPDAKVTQISF
eukprot:TRINITY_DN67882_c8_g6_i1.p1 TRINITY_DN67882_c8_g6~~TRINITY_DN67882_c8_g6_i1.p1  ORF type:complete len:273 (-),score=38.28 TRINITY_DN67882_c8_g6_i1:265-1083(-)